MKPQPSYTYDTQRQSWLTREALVRNLERCQDFIIVSLCVGLFCVMFIRLGEMYLSLLKPLNFQSITSDILFILILVELFRLLILYLQEQRISIGATVEVSIVSALREVILQGVLEIPLNRILGVCGFLVVLGGLLLVRVWIFRNFSLVNLTDAAVNSDTAQPFDQRLDQRLYPGEQYPF